MQSLSSRPEVSTWGGEQRLGLGCMALSGIYGGVPDEQAKATLFAALEVGIQLFDTAPLYGDGHNELLLGRFLGERPVRISTKFGLTAGKNGQLKVDSSPTAIRRSAENSLRHLRREQIDLFLQHRPDPRVSDDEVAQVGQQLIVEGKIAAFGLSGTPVSRVRQMAGKLPLRALQNELSLLVPEALEELENLPEGIAYLAYSPLGRGVITDSAFAQQGDYRRKRCGPAPVSLLKTLQSIAAVHGRMTAAIALSWVLSHSDRIIALPGCRQPWQVNQLRDLPTLSPAEIARLSDAAITAPDHLQ